MYRRLAYPKFFCGLPDCGIVINDVIGNSDCTLFDVFLHGITPETVFYNLCRKNGTYVQQKDDFSFTLQKGYLAFSAALFVFLSRTAGAGIVSADFWGLAYIRLIVRFLLKIP